MPFFCPYDNVHTKMFISMATLELYKDSLLYLYATSPDYNIDMYDNAYICYNINTEFLETIIALMNNNFHLSFVYKYIHYTCKHTEFQKLDFKILHDCCDYDNINYYYEKLIQLRNTLKEYNLPIYFNLNEDECELILKKLTLYYVYPSVKNTYDGWYRHTLKNHAILIIDLCNISPFLFYTWTDYYKIRG